MSDSVQAAHLFFGHWVLDPTQSQYQMSQPPATGSYGIEPDGDALKFTMDWTDAAGKAFHMIYHATPDGNDQPYTDNPAVDAICCVLVDDNTLDTISKKDGQVLAVGRRALSPDGQTMTVTQSGQGPNGKFDNLSVYKKQ
jgi:hypothetical protein